MFNLFKKKETSPYKKGDVIYAQRNLYRHFGVYSGDGMVIHFADKKSGLGIKANVVETSLDVFSKGAKIHLCQFTATELNFSPRKTLKRARSRLGGKGFNIVTNNCEHFALWCKTGDSVSMQTQNAIERIFGVQCEWSDLKRELTDKVLDAIFFDFVYKISDFFEKIDESIPWPKGEF